MMKMDGFQHYKNIHVVDLIAFGVLRVLVLVIVFSDFLDLGEIFRCRILLTNA
jgi:hypothetical protein